MNTLLRLPARWRLKQATVHSQPAGATDAAGALKAGYATGVASQLSNGSAVKVPVACHMVRSKTVIVEPDARPRRLPLDAQLCMATGTAHRQTHGAYTKQVHLQAMLVCESKHFDALFLAGLHKGRHPCKHVMLCCVMLPCRQAFRHPIQQSSYRHCQARPSTSRGYPGLPG